VHLVLFSRCCEPSGENNILLVLLYPFQILENMTEQKQSDIFLLLVKTCKLKIKANQMHPESVVYITWIHGIFPPFKHAWLLKELANVRRFSSVWLLN